MEISKLPKDIQILVERRCREQGKLVMPGLAESFTWARTTEGHKFWLSLNRAAYYGVMVTNIKLKKDAIRNSL